MICRLKMYVFLTFEYLSFCDIFNSILLLKKVEEKYILCFTLTSLGCKLNNSSSLNRKDVLFSLGQPWEKEM